MRTTFNLFDSYTAILAMDQVAPDKAILAISNPELNPKELSAVLEASITGKFKDKEGNETK